MVPYINIFDSGMISEISQHHHRELEQMWLWKAGVSLGYVFIDKWYVWCAVVADIET